MTSSLRLKFLLVAALAIMLGLGAVKYQASVLIAVMDPEDEEETDEECTSTSCGEEDESDAGDTTEPPPPPPPACTQDTWSCDGKFSACSDDGVQTQKCTLSFDCPTAKTPAPTTKKCTPPPPPPPPPPACTEDKWSCDGKWSACSADGVQTQKCSLAVDCDAVKTPAPTTKKCTPPPPPPPPPPPVTNEQPVITPAVTNESEDEEEATEEVEIPEEEAKLREQEEQIRKQQEEAARAALEAAARERAEAEAQLAAFSKSAGVSSSGSAESGSTPASGGRYSKPPTADPNIDSDRDGIIDAEDQYPMNPDVNGNGVPDGTDMNLGKSYTVVDQEDVQLRTEVAVVKKQLETEGKSKTEVEEVVQATFKKKRAEKKQANLKEVSLKKFHYDIKDGKGDADKDGITDTVAVAFGIDPTDKTEPEKGFASTAEMKIYSANATAIKAKKVTMNVYNGNALSKAGATVLATCESGASYTLAAYDVKGKRTVTAKETCAENDKMAFVTDHSKLPQGKYLFQIVKDRSPVSFVPYLAVLPPVALAAGDNASDPVIVDIVTDTQVPQPVVQSIEGLDVAGLKDIKVEAGEDGRIRVSGSSDISTMVVGTFKSAVFTSAMLADIDSGFFEVVSPRPLEDGDHEVVIYATRPEEAVQSQPVRLRFSIIPTAKAATDEELVGGETSDGEVRSSAESSTSSSSQTTLMLVVGGAVVLVAAGVVVIRRKKTVV